MQKYLENLSTSEEVEIPKFNRLIYDWVSFSTRIHTPDQIMDLIGMRDVPWEIVNGHNGYTFAHTFGGVSIYFCDGEMSHVGGFYLLNMSGQGCRTFETYGNGDYDKLFRLVQKEEGKPKSSQDVRLTRLDVAYDDMTGVLDLKNICNKTLYNEFTSRFKTPPQVILQPASDGLSREFVPSSVNFGLRRSNVYIRIYNKALERGYVEDLHWVRCEMQLRSEDACGFVFQLQDHQMSEVYCGALRNYLIYRERNDNDSNKRRWEESSFWIDFLNNVKAMSIVEKPGVIYNLSACERYVLTQPVGSIKTLISIYGAEAFIDMIEKQPKPKNPKYKRLILEAKQELIHKEEIAGVRSIDLNSDSDLIEYRDFVDEMKHEYQNIANNAREKSEENKRSFKRKSAYDRLVERGIIKTYTDRAVERGIIKPKYKE
mgnify:CR=1 FL=1